MTHDEPRGPLGGPLARATATLLDWLSGAGVAAALAPPGQPDPDPGSLYVWPVALLPEQAVRGSAGHDELPLRVRYLLAGGTGDELDRVLAASLGAGSVEVVIEPVSVDIWQAFGLHPRLGLYVDVRTRTTRPRSARARVRQPMLLDTRPLAAIRGQLVGPGGTPVPGVRVTVIDTGASVYTDGYGRFGFPALPAGQTVRLLLAGKGLELVAEVTAPADEPVVIHCEMEEV